MFKKIEQTVDFLNSKVNFKPEIWIILWTGLGWLVKEIDIKYKISYEEIPNFPVSTIESHKWEFIFGILWGKNVVAMRGRFHFYEWYDMFEVTYPIRVMKVLWIEKLIVSNACWGLNPNYEKGDIMLINDHINLQPLNPLIGKNYDELGPRFPDMSEVYNKDMLKKAISIAKKHNIKYQTGVYVSVTGPCLETPAEYKYFRTIGADGVGMSTVPEIIVARHMNIPCFAVSIVTNICVEGKIKEVSINDVIGVANKAEPKMSLIIKNLIKSL